MRKNTGLLFILSLLFFISLALVININGRSFFGHEIRFAAVDDYLIGDTAKAAASDVAPVVPDDKIDSVLNVIYQNKSEQEVGAYIDSLVSLIDQPVSEKDLKPSPFLINEPVNGVYPLDAFFEKLAALDSNQILIRVGHYGDSQIEGDRMTYNLRKLFQARFKGEGVGYLPLTDITDPVSYTRLADNNWQRHTVVTNKIKGFAYGPGGSAYRYAPSSQSSVKLNILSPYKKVFLQYGFGSDSSSLEVYSAGSKLMARIKLNQKTTFNLIPINLASNDAVLRFVFRGPSPCIYGISFDGNSGIQFDNFGLRGQAGDGLMSIPVNQLTQMKRETNTYLDILQFGGNVVPGLKTEKMLSIYGDIYKKLYLHFKAAMNNGSLLIIGVNDVSRSVNGIYQSYPNISELRYLQRKAAIENGFAFFDIYELMGGENSIKTWHEKGLAARDGHFSDKGRQIVSKELYKAIMAEYNSYLARKKPIK
jgi:hypothetical protein